MSTGKRKIDDDDHVPDAHRECAVYDFTTSGDSRGFADIHRDLRTLCKAYVFQLERGEQRTEKNPNGYLHYQGRLSLWKKQLIAAAAILLRSKTGHVYSLSHSSNNSRKGEAFYIMKEQTKIDGPWSDKDYVEPQPLTMQMRKVQDQGLRPWQLAILEHVKEYDDRRIHVIVDPDGNHGKGTLSEYIGYKQLGLRVPPLNKMEDIAQFVMSHPPANLYILDLPRAMNKSNLAEMFQGIECLKDGYVWDKRYKGKYRQSERPNIIVFTNTAPDESYLTASRWVMHSIPELDEEGINMTEEPEYIRDDPLEYINALQEKEPVVESPPCEEGEDSLSEEEVHSEASFSQEY